jgi:hypothetical protein
MPRSLVVAFAAASILAFLGIVSFVAWVLDPTIPMAGLHGLGLGSFAAALLAYGVRRRDERIRASVFLLSLAGALMMGSGAVPAIAPFLVAGGQAMGSRALAGLPIVVLLAVVATALSRPSARAWFAPPAA